MMKLRTNFLPDFPNPFFMTTCCLRLSDYRMAYEVKQYANVYNLQVVFEGGGMGLQLKRNIINVSITVLLSFDELDNNLEGEGDSNHSLH
jgi:hypothetical protein